MKLHFKFGKKMQKKELRQFLIDSHVGYDNFIKLNNLHFFNLKWKVNFFMINKLCKLNKSNTKLTHDEFWAYYNAKKNLITLKKWNPVQSKKLINKYYYNKKTQKNA